MCVSGKGYKWDKIKKYDINCNYVLNGLAYFDVCCGSLIPDITHDILEGALQFEVKLMIQVMTREENYFTLNIFNSQLENIDYGYMEINNKPTSLSLQTINSDGNSLTEILPETVIYYSALSLQTPLNIHTSQVLSQVQFIFLPHTLRIDDFPV